MAVGETSGQAGETAPRRLITAGGGRRRAEQGAPGSVVTIDPDVTEAEVPEGLVDSDPADIAAPPAVPDELERILTEDEEIERKTREHHETPHFRKEVD
jgi:small subunit ribosomal protein S3